MHGADAVTGIELTRIDDYWPSQIYRGKGKLPLPLASALNFVADVWRSRRRKHEIFFTQPAIVGSFVPPPPPLRMHGLV